MKFPFNQIHIIFQYIIHANHEVTLALYFRWDQSATLRILVGKDTSAKIPATLKAIHVEILKVL